MDKNEEAFIFCLKETNFSPKGTCSWQCGNEKKNLPCQRMSKETWNSSNYIRKNRLKTKTVIRDKEVHYIKIKGKTQQEDITIVNVNAPNIGASKYIKVLIIGQLGG